MIDAASQRINERLAEIEAQRSRPFDQHAPTCDDDFTGELDEQLGEEESNEHELGERSGVQHGEQGGVSPPINIGTHAAEPLLIDRPDDDPAVEAAAQAAFQRILSLIDQQ
jgi:hypothetical protein